MSAAYQQLLGILSRYLSTVNAQGAISSALRARNVTPESLTLGDLPGIVPLLNNSIRLFVDPAKQEEVRAQLNALRGRVQPISRTLPISDEGSISEARSIARDLCQMAGARALVLQKVVTIVSELARNVVSYTPGGRMTLAIGGDVSPVITVRSIDSGSGIPNLEEILAGRFRSRTGMGKGLRGVQKLADRFNIDTGPRGTTIEVEVAL